MSISKDDVMDRMIRKILGYVDAKHAIHNHLTVKLGSRLCEAYGRQNNSIDLSLEWFSSSPWDKFVVAIITPGAILTLTTENLILYHDEIVDSLEQLKCLVTSHRKRQQEIAEYKKHLAVLQQIELEKLYNQYS